MSLSRRGFLKLSGVSSVALAVLKPTREVHDARFVEELLRPTSFTDLAPTYPRPVLGLLDEHGQELTTPGYERVPVEMQVEGGVATNKAVSFPVAGADWGTIHGVAIYDAGSRRSLFKGPLTKVIRVGRGDTVGFQGGSITVDLS